MLICCKPIAISVPSTPLLLTAMLLMILPVAKCFAEVRIEKGVEFLSPGRKEMADLYLPANSKPGELRPAVVIIHGGGWNGGKRDAKREINIGTNLAIHGYVGMSIDYTLASKTRATWPQNLHDCKTAVRWLRMNAERLQIDPKRIGVIGGSAGGHLAAMVAFTMPEDGLDPQEPYGEFSCQVRCCVDLYGISNVPTYHDVHMLGKSFKEAPELYRAASPVTYVRAESPPTLILHGTKDTTVNLDQSKLLATVLRQAGVEHKLVVIPGAVHSFDLQPKQRDLRPLVIGFFDKHLK
ncbi:alpha/beta hydrolase [Bythopirellula polymerisocia]|uniref:Carboxylesterase NlhH n=1 Tax=Bythopirellula polymerisocia TaxID=2528003 RepID=A0A5C6CY63_9BACT|nr:alpha/beta hydrolase [Bythopirellula polymerisocia]TWU27579.1 Carboxylesterase NlhH [Bythopirellula polymerisocia]